MRRYLALFTALLLVGTAGGADHAQQVKALVTPLIESENIVGCVVGVLDNGEQEIYSFGEIHRGKGDKPNADTMYEIGSITKAFTGTLFADMIDRGLIKLDAPLQDFVPNGVQLHVAKDQPIKLVDLASQSSGLPRMPYNMGPKDIHNPYADYTPELMFEFLAKYEPQRAPGEYEYSNFGMGLLGTVLARQAEKSYEEVIVERICDPLNMNDTRIHLSDEQRKRLAPPYDAQLSDAKNWDFDAFAGAGALRSTLNDMLKFAKASLGSDNDSPVTKAIHTAWTPHFGKPGKIRVGLGWHQARDGETWWHNGQTAGYSSALFVYPPKKLAVVVLCNTASDQTTPLAEKILQSALGIKTSPIEVRKTVKVDSAILERYVGKYALSFAFAITVTLEDGKLMAQATGQSKYQLFPESETKFFYKVVDAQISFEKGDNGKVNALVLHQNGQDLPGVRIPDTQAK
jgi:CubicO group peptidase (beta-lactamase class C family)